MKIVSKIKYERVFVFIVRKFLLLLIYYYYDNYADLYHDIVRREMQTKVGV